MSTKIVQVKPLTLSSNIGTSNTTAIVSGMIGLDGVDLTQTDFGSIIYGTFEPNTTREEAVSFTITSCVDGVAEIDFDVSGRGLIGKSPYGTGGITYSHSAGAKLVISNNPNLFNKFTAKDNDETVTGAWSFPTTPVGGNNPATKTWTEAAIAVVSAVVTALDAVVVKLTGSQTIAGVKTFSSSPIVPAPTTDLQAATKKYVDDVSVAGAADGGETTKGIFEEGTDAEVLAGTPTGSTGAKLAVTAEKLKAFLDNKVKLRVSKSGTQSVTGGATAQITFDTEDIDSGNSFASNQFTAPRTGYYDVNFITTYLSNSSSAEGVHFEIRVDGTAVLGADQSTNSTTAGEGSSVSFGGLLYLTSTQVVTVYCIDGASHNITISAGIYTKLSILEL